MAGFMTLPKIGVNMVEGVVSEWLVAEGDAVVFGEMALRAETDKDVQDIPADQSGVVLKILGKPGDRVRCGEPIAIVGEAGENCDDLLKQYESGAAGRPASDNAAAPGPRKVEAAPEAGTGKRIKISPLARKLAGELGVDYTKITPKGQRITKADVLACIAAEEATASLPGSAAVADTVAYAGVRKSIGARLTESIVTKPATAETVRCDMTKLLARRAEIKKDTGEKVSLNVFIAKACARALRDHPMLNTQLDADGDRIRIMADVHIGIAVETGRGLVVPVLRNVDKRGLFELSGDYKALVDRAREGRSRPGKLSGATFTISNLGALGVECFNAIVSPPECAILAVGAIIKQPVVVNDEIAIRPMMQITLSFDHRIIDGAPAARFLARVKANLEDPLRSIPAI